MRRLISAVIGIALLLPAVARAGPRDRGSKDEPQVSGVTQGNVGCAILEKSTPVKGKLLLVGVVYARTEYKVLSTYNAQLPRAKFTGPGAVKELNDLAAKNKIKLVIIRTSYSDAELAQAKGLCGQPQTPDKAPSAP